MSKNITFKLKNNIIVPVPCFFTKKLSIDYLSIKKHINFLLKKGVKHLYIGQSASELERLSYNERIKFAIFVKKTINKKSKLILQPLGHTNIEDQIKESKKLISIGCDALVIQPVQIKTKQDFYSTPFKLAEYSPIRHDNYYIEYMEKICENLKKPIIFHNREFSFGKSLSLNAIKTISKIKNVISIKEHNSDIKIRKKIYKLFQKNNKISCYDGFSKEDYIITSKHGVNSRHSNFSWFDPEWDKLFLNLVNDKKYKFAKKMIKLEEPIKKIIVQTGYAGYKQLVTENKIVNVRGYTRMPGCNLDIKSLIKIKNALKKFNFNKKMFLNKFY